MRSQVLSVKVSIHPGSHLQFGKQWAHFDARRGCPSFLPGNIYIQVIYIAGNVHFCHLLFLAGTNLDVVFVVDVAVVVVVVAAAVVVVVVVVAAVVVVVFVVAAGAGAVLFPLFICNHAQDHLAHLQKIKKCH